MKQLNTKQILDAIKQARYEHSQGILNQELIEATKPEFWSKIRNTQSRKQELLKLAKGQTARPNSRKHPLGHSLNNYINPKKSTYDATFTKQLKALAPHWFWTRSNQADINKQKLLQLAKTKQPRPNSKSSLLGRALTNYTNPESGCYDKNFVKKIKLLSPKWFRQ